MRYAILMLMLISAPCWAVPTGTVTRSVMTDSNGVLIGWASNLVPANGIATTAQLGQVSVDVATISNLAASALATGVFAQATADSAMATGAAAIAALSGYAPTGDLAAVSNLAASAMATGVAAQASAGSAMATGVAARAIASQAQGWISSFTNTMFYSNTTVYFDYFLLTSNPAVPLDNADFPGIYRQTALTTNSAPVYTNAAGWYLWRDDSLSFWDASTDLGNACFLYQSLSDTPASTWIGTEHCDTVNGEVSGAAIYVTNTTVFTASSNGLFITANTMGLSGLPTAAPTSSGHIWNSNGYLRVEP